MKIQHFVLLSPTETGTDTVSLVCSKHYFRLPSGRDTLVEVSTDLQLSVVPDALRFKILDRLTTGRVKVTELEVDYPDGQLLLGEFAKVSLQAQEIAHNLLHQLAADAKARDLKMNVLTPVP